MSLGTTADSDNVAGFEVARIARTLHLLGGMGKTWILGCTVAALVACSSSGGGSVDADVPHDTHVGEDAGLCGEPPPPCGSKCQTQVEDFGMEDCCDSLTCNCRPSTRTWEQHVCDPGDLDAGVGGDDG